ncbi:MAG: N-acetylmuramoyl-L-alanine amidase, partial [Clostridium sp.]
MLKQMLIDSNKYGVKCPYSMTPKGICIHNTANDASALAERNNVNRWDNDAEVSFHIAIDDIEAIQLIPFNRNAWHSGDGGNGPGNRNYIAIEICYSKSGGDRFIKAEKRAAKEVAALLKEYGWTINNVKKHKDFSNKYCPHRTLDMGWQRFLNMIQAELNSLNITTESIFPLPLKMKSDAMSYDGEVKIFNKGDLLTADAENQFAYSIELDGKRC